MFRECKREYGRWCGLASFLTLFGCASAQDYVDHYAHRSPSLEEFTVCHGYGCRFRETVRIEPFAWEEVTRLFQPAPATAAEERVRLGRAIALLEIKIGVATGTHTDRAAADTFGGEPNQLDCIDETVNTTTYLRLLMEHGLMQKHHIGTAAQRGWVLASFFGSTDFTTNTAVIIDKETRVAFAVDSYFYPNGRPPKIMPLVEWNKNWRPAPDDPLLLPLLNPLPVFYPDNGPLLM